MPDPMTADPSAPDAQMQELLANATPALRAFLRRLAPTEVDDLHQETLARAWRSRQTFDPERGSGNAWLLRIAYRAFVDLRDRRPTTAGELSEQLTAVTADPLTRATARDEAASLLDLVPEPERDVLLRFHRDGQTIKEIATALVMPAGTVKSHLHRARNRLWAEQRRQEDDR